MKRTPSLARATVAMSLLVAFAWPVRPSGTGRVAAAEPSGEVAVVYTCGEVSVDEAGEYVVSPTSSLGVEFRRRAKPASPGAPGLGYEGYLSLGESPVTKAGLTFGLDWEPLQGLLAGRQYSVNTSLGGRWPGEAGYPPEQAWEVDAAVKETGLGRSSLEAGGRAGAQQNRLSGRDYREAAAYLATRFALDGEPCGLAWVEPDWLRGFTSLFEPPPEPGVEERSDLPYWYEAAALPGLPPLPPPEASPAAAEPRLSRLTVATRHTQTWRAYAGDPSHDWEAGETRLEVREKRAWGEVLASCANTVKYYPADPTRTYHLAEGELEVSGPAGPGRGRAAAAFRQRLPWEGTSEAYRQHGLSLGYSLPGAPVDWRFGGEWRQRRYESKPDRDYAVLTLETEVSWPATRKSGQPAAAATLAVTEERPFNPAGSLEYRLRLRLRGELPAGTDQTLSTGLAWERIVSLPAGGPSAPETSELLLRVAWQKTF